MVTRPKKPMKPEARVTARKGDLPVKSEMHEGFRGETIGFILDAYADEEVTRVLATSFTSVWRRSLTLHLLQAPLSFQCFCELGRLLGAETSENADWS